MVTKVGREITQIRANLSEASLALPIVQPQYEPGNVLRYAFNTTPGVTDMTAAIQAALDVLYLSGLVDDEFGAARCYIPSGDYLVSSTIYFRTHSVIIGQAAGLGAQRGTNILAKAGMTGWVFENRELTLNPAAAYTYGVRFEHLRIYEEAGEEASRTTPALRTMDGINWGPFGNNSYLKDIKLGGMGIGIKIGGTVVGQQEQVQGWIDTAIFSMCDTAVLCEQANNNTVFENCQWDGTTISLHVRDTSSTATISVEHARFEGIPAAATELIWVDNCSSSLISVRNSHVNAATAATDLAFIRNSADTAPNKARIKLDGVYSTTATNYILKDDLDAINILFSAVDSDNTTYPILYHNMTTLWTTGQGGPAFLDDVFHSAGVYATLLSSTGQIKCGTDTIWATSAGSPEGAVTAPLGSICSDTTNGKLYVKETGVGNTGWVVK